MAAMNDPAKMGRGLLIFMGVLTSILGIMAILSPLAAGIAVAVSVGFLLVGMGITRIVNAIRARKERSLVWGLVVGLLAIVVGVMTVTRPMLSVMSLTLFLGIYLFVHGIVEIIAAFEMRPAAGWSWRLFNSIVALLLGLAIWRQWPISGAWALGVMVGVHILSTGSSMIAIGVVAGKVSRSIAPNTGAEAAT